MYKNCEIENCKGKLLPLVIEDMVYSYECDKCEQEYDNKGNLPR